MLLASACLPTMFQAIEIDGETYWDGGYSGNPTLSTLVRETEARDTILMPINPIERVPPPRSASEILNRLNEVSFNAVVLKELNMMALLRKVADPGDGEGGYGRGCASIWCRNDILTELGASSKLNAESTFLEYLHKEGRKAAQTFLDEHARGSRQALDPQSRRAARGDLTHGPPRHPRRSRTPHLPRLSRLEHPRAARPRPR